MKHAGPEIDGSVRRVATWINVVVIAMVVATLALVMWPRIADAIGATDRTDRSPAYNAGERIDVPEGWYEESPHTLVLFAQARCGACLKAQPFLADLVTMVEGRAAVVLAYPSLALRPGSPTGRHETELRYALSLGIPETAVFEAPSGLRAQVTPTLVLVDRLGTVIGAWEGARPDEQGPIAETIAAAVATSPPAVP